MSCPDVRFRLLVCCAVAVATASCGDDTAEPLTDAAIDTGATDDADDAASDADASEDADIDADAAPTDDADADESDVVADAGDADAGDDADAADAGPTSCVPVATPAGYAQYALANGWSVDVDASNGAWRLLRPDDGTVVMEAPPLCFDDGDGPQSAIRFATGAPQVEMLFGAFRVTLDGGRSELAWQDASSVPAAVRATAEEVVLDLGGTVEGASLRFASLEGAVRVSLTPAADLGAELVTRCREGESFFGLGAQVTGMDLRGRTYPLFTQEQGNGKPERPGWPLQNYPEASYAPMGVWHSTEGYSAITDVDGYGEISLCDGSPYVTLRGYPEAVSFTVVTGGTPGEQLEAVTSWIGRLPTAPPAWTFAPWNDAVGGPERLEEVAAILRNNDIPSSAIWSEDWIGGAQGPFGYRLSYAWEWDPTRYPDLPEQIDALHAEGFAFLAYFNTFVPSTTRMFEEGQAGGFLARNADGAPYTVTDPASRQTGLVDLTNPEARAWFGGYMRTAAADLGIDGWMADFTEWMPVDAVLHDGSGWTYHNRWPLDFQRLVRDVMTEVHADDPRGTNDWCTFARSGWASTAAGGAGALTPTMWGGDQDTSWGYEDGYPTVLPIATHLGLSGVAIFGSDIAGYSSLTAPNTTKALFYRWVAMGAFHGLMRTHHGSDECGNWSFDRDAETLDHYGRYARIHTVLYPEFRRLLGDALDRGLPLVRHPWLVEPGAPALWTGRDYAFFLGDDILVEPVLDEGVTTRDAELPGEGWWPLFGDAAIAAAAGADGVVRFTVDAPVTEIPVFVRPGSVLALLAEPVDSFYGSSAADVSDLDDVAGRYAVAVYPTPAGVVRAYASGELSVSASGVLGSTPFVGASIGDVALPWCSDAEVPCIDADGRQLRLGAGATEVTLVGGGVVNVATSDVGSVRVGLAGAAWEGLAVVPPAPDLDAIVAPPCSE